MQWNSPEYEIVNSGGTFSFANDPAEQKSWFEKACERDIQCDVLVISGHFGGSFFGEESEYYLSLKEMEKLTCQRKCENVLSHVKEVFLFGCNTLAGKVSDKSNS